MSEKKAPEIFLVQEILKAAERYSSYFEKEVEIVRFLIEFQTSLAITAYECAPSPSHAEALLQESIQKAKSLFLKANQQ